MTLAVASAAVTARVWVPGSAPRVQVVAAWPLASVVAAAGSAEPWPAAGAKVTLCPAMGRPCWSRIPTTIASTSDNP